MIEVYDDLRVFGQGFHETVYVDDQGVEVVFSQGADKERTIRGTVISDNRSILIGLIPWAIEGSKVEVRGDNYLIEEIQAKAGLFTYFLSKDYNFERENSEYYPH